MNNFVTFFKKTQILSILMFLTFHSFQSYAQPNIHLHQHDSTFEDQSAFAEFMEAEGASLELLRKKYPNIFIFHGNPSVKEVALTFDDAPDIRFTPKILDILKQYNVRATFFIVGYRAEKQPGLVKRIAMENHVIGNHSFHHDYLPKLDHHHFYEEIMKTQEIIMDITQQYPKFIRPPYGAIAEYQLQWAGEHDFKVINWNVDTMDWKGLSADKVSQNVFNQIQPGAIILQHAGGGKTSELLGTIEALPEIIKKLKSKGYSFVTIEDMLK